MPKNRTAQQATLAIVTAAEALFARRGFADVAVGEVAQAAGVSQGLIYHHFANKRALWDAVFTRIHQIYLAGLQVPDSVATDADPWARIKYRLRYGMEFLLSNPHYARLRAWDRLQGMDTISTLIQEKLREMALDLEVLQRRGLARRDKGAHDFAMGLHIWMAGFADQLLSREDLCCDAQGVAHYLEMILSSLQTRPPQPTRRPGRTPGAERGLELPQ